jgi:hypothetical protein
MRPVPVVVCDGQSLNNYPTTVGSFPDLLATSLGSDAVVLNQAHDGLSWTTLSTDASLRVDHYPALYVRSILLMTGGQSDLAEFDTGRKVYLDFVEYAAARRAAGYDAVIVATIPTSAHYTAPMESARLECNDQLRASTEFDGLADFDRAMPDTTDPDVFEDFLHLSAGGAIIAHDLFLPKVREALAWPA